MTDVDDTISPQAEDGDSKSCAVLVMCVGSTAAEVGLDLATKQSGAARKVPSRLIYCDATPYELLVDRLQGTGFSRQEIDEALPHGSYFELKDPIGGALANDDINAKWRRILFNPMLEQQATRVGQAPGCNGVPALGRLRAEGNDVGAFLRSHLSALTQVSDSTLSLQAGVRVVIVTTLRGGCGTGATPYLAAALREAMMNRGEIHLVVLMPDVFTPDDDDRMRANAYAALQQYSTWHTASGMPLMDGSSAAGPFTSVFPVFGTDGARAINKNNAIAFVTSLIDAQLRPRLQSSLAARRLNLDDVLASDHDGLPMHVEGHVAVSVRTSPEGTNRFIALEWLVACLAEEQADLQRYLAEGVLSTEQDEKVANLLALARERLGAFSAERLMAQLDDELMPTNVLRSVLEAAATRIPSLQAAAVKTGMPVLVKDVGTRFDGFAKVWRRRTEAMARALPADLVHLVEPMGLQGPAVQVAMLRKARAQLDELAKTVAEVGTGCARQRNQANETLKQRLADVQNASGILLGFRKDEVARDVGLAALKPLVDAAMARLGEERHGNLARLLNGVLGEDRDGRQMANVVTALGAAIDQRIAFLTERLAASLRTITGQRTKVRRTIENQSVFSRSVYRDGADARKLTEEAGRQKLNHRNPAPVLAFLRGEAELEQTLAALEKLLPEYSAAARPLLEVLKAEPRHLTRVIHLLREVRPFLPIDRAVEREQELDKRRDTVAILEMPGGKTSWLAEHLCREGVVGKDQITESEDEVLRFYRARVGLPYYAIAPLRAYRKSHGDYVKMAGAVTPYSVPEGPQLPHLEAPRDLLVLRCEGILAEAFGVTDLVAINDLTGTVRLLHDNEDGADTEPFPSIDAAISWLGQHPRVRSALMDAVNREREERPGTYVARLRERIGQAPEPLRRRLRRIAQRQRIELVSAPLRISHQAAE